MRNVARFLRGLFPRMSLRRGGQGKVAHEAPARVDEDGPHEAPPPLRMRNIAQDDDDRRDDVPEVLVRRPRAVDQTPIAFASGVTIQLPMMAVPTGPPMAWKKPNTR